MKEKVLIPTRGVIALDIINSLNSMGMETLLMHSPEDALTLPVKLADRSYKFYSSRLEDSYLDSEAIMEKAREVQADYHPPRLRLPGRKSRVRQALPATTTSVSSARSAGGAGRGGGQDQAAGDRRRPGRAGVLKFSELIRSPLDFESCQRRLAITRSSSSL